MRIVNDMKAKTHRGPTTNTFIPVQTLSESIDKLNQMNGQFNLKFLNTINSGRNNYDKLRQPVRGKEQFSNSMRNNSLENKSYLPK